MVHHSTNGFFKMSKSKVNKVVSRQIWLPNEIVKAIKTQKINDQRKPRERPTLHNAFLGMLKDGLEFAQKNNHGEIPRRNTDDAGYFVLRCDGVTYAAAAKMAKENNVAVVDVIVWLIGVSFKNGFNISMI